MTPLYLTRIALQEFRSFGGISVELPNSPGVLIVHGSNGLGKSSLFDGMEWALTGKIDHFPEAKRGVSESDYLRRWDAPDARPTHVRLEFSDGWVRRLLTSGLDPKGQTELADFFRHPSWQNGIEHLDRYFLLTHFLGQSTVSRMTHRTDKERWEFLQEPAQSDRAMDLVRTLHGHGSSTPARAFEKRAARLTEQARELERLLRDEDALWTEAQLEGAIDDAGALGEGQGILSDLRAVAPDAFDHEDEDIRLAPLTLVELLEGRVAQAKESVRQREQQLESARQIVSGHLAGCRDRTSAEAVLADARRQLAAGNAQIEDAKNALEEAKADFDAALEALTSRQAAIGAIDKFDHAREQSTQRQFWLRQNEEHEVAAVRQLASAEQRVAKAEKRRRVAARLAAKAQVSRQQVDQLARQKDIIEACLSAMEARQQASGHFASLQALHPDLEAEIEDAVARVSGAQRRSDEAAGILEATRIAAGEMSAAVAVIAERLAPDACECPLCETAFAGAAALHARVQMASERLAPTLLPLQQRLTEAVSNHEAEEARLAELLGVHAQRDAAETALHDASRRLHDGLALLGLGDTTTHDQLVATADRFERDSATAAHVARRAAYWLHHRLVGGEDGALGEWTQAARTRNDLASTVETQQRALRAAEEAVADARVAFEAVSTETGLGLEISDGELAAVRRAAEKERGRVAETVEARRARHQAMNEAYSTFAASRTEAEARIDATIAQLAEIGRQFDRRDQAWAELGIDGPTADQGALERAALAIPAMTARFARALERIERLRAGRIAWSRQQRHRVALDEMRAVLNAAPVTDREGLRSQAMEEQTKLLLRVQAVQEAKRIAQEATAETTRRVESFNQEFLEPLSKLMNRLNQAILSEPDIGIGLEMGRGKVEQRAIAGQKAPAFVSKLDPQYIHSEGQMAALAVSMLTAANLTYPWSRWPALIMDDPLQHNDVIHAAAFADMLRNLVRERQFQLFLSTHELSQAEFLRRKFQAADIPCTMVHLVGRGANGVESQITPSRASRPIAAAAG